MHIIQNNCNTTMRIHRNQTRITRANFRHAMCGTVMDFATAESHTVHRNKANVIKEARDRS